MRIEAFGNATLYLGDCLEILPALEPVDHMITDPPYEKIMHAAKAGSAVNRPDGTSHYSPLGFEPIDDIRQRYVDLSVFKCKGWFIAFCTSEGVGRWADAINPTPMKYKRACVWVKPDSMPQMNGQGPAQGAEHFVCAWGGRKHSRWNAGGKRGVYTHCVNNAERSGKHAAEKPRALMTELVHDFTNPGDVILDCFAGSGTTGDAALMAGRHFIGIEKDPEHFDLMVRRLKQAQRHFDNFGCDL